MPENNVGKQRERENTVNNTVTVKTPVKTPVNG